MDENNKGRMALHELLRTPHGVLQLIRRQSAAADYKKAGIAAGLRTLKQDRIEKVIRDLAGLARVHIACT